MWWSRGVHALWDASRPIAVWLTLLLTATQVQWALIRMGRVPQPTQAQVHTFTTLNMVVLLVDAVVGVMILRGRWRQAQALEHPDRNPQPPRTTTVTGIPSGKERAP
jgi:hypothetical protein